MRCFAYASSCVCSSSIFVPMHDSPSFFFNDTATTEIYTLSLHDALPIFAGGPFSIQFATVDTIAPELQALSNRRSEEHTSELQSLTNLVCRLLLEKKKSDVRKRPRLASPLEAPWPGPPTLPRTPSSAMPD